MPDINRARLCVSTEALLSTDRQAESTSPDDPRPIFTIPYLMACRQDRRIIRRITVNGVDMRPVASRARTRDVAETCLSYPMVAGPGKRLTGLRGIDV